MITYLKIIPRLDISMIEHQCAHFSANPKLSYERAFTRIERCLIDAIDRCLVYKLDKIRVLECVLVLDVAGCWNAEGLLNPKNVSSRAGFIIECSCVPIF